MASVPAVAHPPIFKALGGGKGEVKPPKCPTRHPRVGGYIYMHIYVYTYTCGCTHLHPQIRTRDRISPCIYIYIHTHVHGNMVCNPKLPCHMPNTDYSSFLDSLSPRPHVKGP